MPKPGQHSGTGPMPRRCRRSTFDVDVSSSAPASPGSTRCTACARSGYRVVVVDAADGVGGTWYWNRYPGARCDVVSIDYSYTFSEEVYREWSWSERYAQQPEIERYLNWVADRLDLRRDIRLGTRVVGAVYDEAEPGGRSRPTTAIVITARFLVAATGCLSVPNTPQFEGLDDVRGELHHTATWPAAGVDLAGKRVAVIGTGSSGIQVIPVIAETAARAHGHPADRQLQPARRTTRHRLGPGSPAEGVAGAVAPSRLEQLGGVRLPARRALDGRPSTASRRTPSSTGGGDTAGSRRSSSPSTASSRTSRRTSSSPSTSAPRCARSSTIRRSPSCCAHGTTRSGPSGSARTRATSRRSTATTSSLVDARTTPIVSFDASGLVLGDGRHIDLDVVVMATGFDAMTGALRRMGVRGRNGTTIDDAWASGPHTYLGIQVASFPNLFMITGPQSPSVLNNMILGIEHHVRWITNCLDHMRRNDLRSIEPTPAAVSGWDDEVRAAADANALPTSRVLVRGRQHPGQAAGVHGVRRRLQQVRRDVRRDRRGRLHGVRVRRPEHRRRGHRICHRRDVDVLSSAGGGPTCTAWGSSGLSSRW